MKKQSNNVSYSWLNRWYPRILFMAAFAALIASFWQTVERINMLKNPGVPLSCNINPIVDCGTVLSHRLAALFGFPNALIGIVMFSMLTVSAIVLLAGGEYTKKFNNFVLALSSVAFLFSIWFFGVSLYIIGKACIFCMVIWPASVILFWYGLLYWLYKNKVSDNKNSKLLTFLFKNHFVIVFYILLVLFGLYLFRFSDYYFG